MYSKFKTPTKFIGGLLVSAFMVSAAQAVMPEPINPKDAVNMSFDQRLALFIKVNKAILTSTPQEVSAYWKKHIEQLKALSPADREYVNEKMQANWKATTIEQKKTIMAEESAYYNSLSPDQKAAIKSYTDEIKAKQQSVKQ
jgi:DNA-binding helix-hairpin-helix protein with protein kinase domain